MFPCHDRECDKRKKNAIIIRADIKRDKSPKRAIRGDQKTISSRREWKETRAGFRDRRLPLDD
jgi:hypothetical protein